MDETGDGWDTPEDAPIIVLGSGQRCGSTLIQRLATSHPRVMVWGEHGGRLRDLLAMNEVLLQWDANVSAGSRQAFEDAGHDSWIANLLPGPEPLRAAARAYLLELFAAPAARRGRSRWGFKEVRFGFAEASALRSLFGGLVTVHVTRDPRDVLVSLEAWERTEDWWRRDFTREAIRLWAEISRSFLEAGDQPWVLSRRYEDIVADPQRFVDDLAKLLGTPAERFDASVFDRRIHGAADGHRELLDFRSLPRRLPRLVEAPETRAVARELGYV